MFLRNKSVCYLVLYRKANLVLIFEGPTLHLCYSNYCSLKESKKCNPPPRMHDHDIVPWKLKIRGFGEWSCLSSTNLAQNIWYWLYSGSATSGFLLNGIKITFWDNVVAAVNAPSKFWLACFPTYQSASHQSHLKSRRANQAKEDVKI